jgi:cytoskeletal protein RodZ
VSDEQHRLGEVLRSAREAKGVDLARVERDTKIRARYLAALESGEYRELPGAVYTRGFLRNYGQYLGLDPEYLIDLFRLESAATQPERRVAVAPPRPIAARGRRTLVVTPNALAAATLTIIVGALVVYFGFEFWTFARTPDLRVTAPAGDLSQYARLEYTVEGVTAPKSRITVTNGQRQNPEMTADAEGHFSIPLKLVPGSNVITLVAHDPVTKRDSDPVSRTINVVLATPSPSPSAALALTAPADGAKAANPVTVSGTAAPGAKLTVSAKATAAAPVTFRVVDGFGRPVKVQAKPPAAPKPVAVTVGADGSFSAKLDLAPGSWEISVGAADGKGSSVSRSVTVAAATGVQGSLNVGKAASYLQVDEDGAHAEGYGRVAEAGTKLALQAKQTIRVRAGNAAAVTLTINGVALGPMGGSGQVVEWRITRLP